MSNHESTDQGTPDQAVQANMRVSIPGAVVAAATVALLAAGCTASGHQNKPPVPGPTDGQHVVVPGQIDILAGDWNYMPGVERQGPMLHVSPTDFKIVKQDGSGGQPNPPVNLYGTRVTLSKASGDFSVSATIDNNHGNASLRLYNSAPVTTDEFRLEPGSVSLTEKGDKLDVQIMDGSPQADITDPQPVFKTSLELPNPYQGSVTVTKHGNTIDISEGKKLVVSVPYGGIFKSGRILFGLDSTSGGFDISSLTAQGTDGNTLTTVGTSKEQLKKTPGGLQDLANKYRPGFKIGAAVALGPLTSDKAYAEQVINNFGSITLENAMKPQFISPKKGVYEFGEADAIIAFAKKHGLAVHGHCIAFSEAEPSWMQNLPTGTPSERAETAKILLGYAGAVANHFKDSLNTLDVINEPFDTDNGTSLQQNVWYRALGPNYAAKVLRTVHEAAPKIKLVVNENGAEQAGDRQEALFMYIKNLKDQGAPIYAVGLQSHVYDKDNDIIYPEDVTAIIDRYAAMGVKVRISEMDVPANAAYSADDPEAGSGAQYQAWQFSKILGACVNNPSCVSWTTWGVNNGYDIFQGDSGGLSYGQDLPINANGTPTQAYKALANSLRK